jgi:hypothetical protein
VIQQALGGFPMGCNYGQQVILTWLMTLPEHIDRAQAARSLLAARMPSCCTTMIVGCPGSSRNAPVHNFMSCPPV